jgi:hypothetical protein
METVVDNGNTNLSLATYYASVNLSYAPHTSHKLCHGSTLSVMRIITGEPSTAGHMGACLSAPLTDHFANRPTEVRYLFTGNVTMEKFYLPLPTLNVSLALGQPNHLSN